MLTAARSSIREGFRANAALEPTSPEFPAAVKHAEEVATILRQNVVQGKREGDRYSPCRLATPSPALHYTLTGHQSYGYTRTRNEATTIRSNSQAKLLARAAASVVAVDEDWAGSLIGPLVLYHDTRCTEKRE